MVGRHHVGMAVLGLGVLLTVLGCVWTEDLECRALVEGFNKGLGQYKEGRIIQAGPPTQCTPAQNGGGEICEWRTNGNQLLYSYDARGIARSWSYMDSHLGRMESAQYPDQRQQSEGSVWQSIIEAFHGMKVCPGVGGSTPTGR